jgi:predicted site-specific integrase-resolvase
MSKQYTIGDFAKRIGRSASTVRRWERDGLIKSKRLPSGHRYFDEDDIRTILGKADEKRLTVVYCRVSSHGQKDDLQSQVAAMEQYCLGAGIAVDEWVQEVGGGMNFKRKQFLQLMDRVASGDIGRLIVAHKDRLVRFGFDFLDHVAKRSACVIEVVNQESLSPQEEMTEDLLSIVHTFSCRLYGMRKYKRKSD